VASNPDDFDCNKCRWGRHCDKDNPAPNDIFEIKVPGYEIRQNTCFLTEYDRDSDFWLRQFSAYNSGFLLKKGGAGDQPAPYMQAMRLIKWLGTQE